MNLAHTPRNQYADDGTSEVLFFWRFSLKLSANICAIVLEDTFVELW